MSPWESLLLLSLGIIVRVFFVLARLYGTSLICMFAALHNLFSPILAGIFAGNAVVVKCSENVVWSSQWFINAIKECLRACDKDPELVQVNSLIHILLI